MNIQEALATVVDHIDLSTEQMNDVMRQIMTGGATDAQIGGFLVALRMKSESLDEITGAAMVMRELVTPVVVENRRHLVDIVGTGGDGANLFNVSTASAFVAAAAGCRVAKHGNRSVSSKSGSSDLLEAAGIDDWERAYQMAYGLLSNPSARDAFDVTRESEATRQRYGHTHFGQSALVARRLVEARVPYVQLNWSQTVEAITPNYDFGWDTHIYNFEMLMDRHCPLLDRVLPELMTDLQDRGLLEDTLVVVISEFGRTPKINPRAARDHWPQCYFSLWSGAGVPTGGAIGQSDKLGEHPLTTPITPLMVGTTITELAGLTTQDRAELNVLSGGTVIDEFV